MTHRVDMNAFMADAAPRMDKAVRSLEASSVRALYAQFAELRPMFGLVEHPTKLTTLWSPGQKVSNLKIAKNAKPTLSLTMSSHASCRVDIDGTTYVLNTCRWAGLCVGVCVLSHGRGSFSQVRAARNWRTMCLWTDPEGFAMVLRHEILKAGPVLARLNVNSDLPWHLVPSLWDDVEMHTYDYTKDPSILDTDGWVLPTYRKIYSLNERSPDVEAFLARGGNVAMVTNRVKGQPTIESWHGHPVIDGDLSDNRYDDPPGSIVDLYAKGKAKGRKSKFVQVSYPTRKESR